MEITSILSIARHTKGIDLIEISNTLEILFGLIVSLQKKNDSQKECYILKGMKKATKPNITSKRIRHIPI